VVLQSPTYNTSPIVCVARQRAGGRFDHLDTFGPSSSVWIPNSTSGALRALSHQALCFVGWTLTIHPLPWVEFLRPRDPTYGSRWCFKVLPTTRAPSFVSRASAPEEDSIILDTLVPVVRCGSQTLPPARSARFPHQALCFVGWTLTIHPLPWVEFLRPPTAVAVQCLPGMGKLARRVTMRSA